MWRREVPERARAVGFRWLVDTYHLREFPHHCWSYVLPKWEKKTFHFADSKLALHFYPPSVRVPENVFEHLEFALKHEGVNFLILKNVLKEISVEAFTDYITSRPTGKYARILWYLYEKFTCKSLPFLDLDKGTYTPLLDPQKYYFGKGTRSQRHRVTDNLLGTIHFSPIVRRTALLEKYEKKQLGLAAHDLAKRYNPSVLARAMRYLYTKETVSSWEIEREKPDQAKLVKFVDLLHRADSLGPLSERTLADLQKSIVDPRFASDTYRNFQNYVGEEPGMGQLILHYITPRPSDVPDLMQQLLKSFALMEESGIHAVVTAAVLSFGFVFIHPFEDGNGRMHRFLVHYALARSKFTPEGIIFPISAAIVRDMKRYDQTLEAFSKPLMKLIAHYTVNDLGEMDVLEETKDDYSHIDFTSMAEYLFECVDKAITTDFQEELAFLADYDRIKHLCKEVVDMPDQKLDLFIKCVRQNGGHLSAGKKEAYFHMLTPLEIEKMEHILNLSK